MLLDVKQRGEQNLKSLGGEFEAAGSKAKTAAKDAEELGSKAEKGASEVEKAGKKAEGSTSRLAGAFKSLGSAAGGWGLPFSESASKVGESLDSAGGGAKGLFSKLSAVGGAALGAGTAGLVAVGAESIKMADQFDAATGQIAASAGISSKAATQIGNAFKGIKGMETATELASAYGKVAGQLGATQGHALSSAQAVQVMSAAADLADAKMGSLSQTTSSLATVMQSWGMQAGQAGQVADTLYGISTKTGVGMSTITSSLQRMHARLGALTPSLSQTAGLMMDLAQHGETGRQSISAVSTAMQTLLTQTKLSAVSQQSLLSAQDAVAKSKLAETDATTKLSLAQLSYNQLPTIQNQAALQNAQNAVTAAQLSSSMAAQKLAMDQKGLNTSQTAASIEAQKLGLHLYDVHGQFVGMASVIGQLKPKLAGMTQQQQLFAVQTLFGAHAGQQMLDVINAGPSSFNKASAAVNKAGQAHRAAGLQMKTLSGQAKVLGVDLENVGVSFGQFLIPKLEIAASWLGDTLNFFREHETAAKALAAVIGGTLAVAVGAFTVNKLANMGRGVMNATKEVGTFISKIKGIGSGGGGGGMGAAGEQAAAPINEAASNLEQANTAMETSGTTLSDAASALSAAAEKLSAAGSSLAGDITSSATKASSDLTAAGTTTSGDLTTAGTTTAGDLTAAATTSATELDAAGAEVAVEMKAGAVSASETTTTSGGVMAAEMKGGAVGAAASEGPAAESGGMASGMLPLAILASMDAASNWLPGAKKAPAAGTPAAKFEQQFGKLPIIGPLADNVGNSVVHGLESLGLRPLGSGPRESMSAFHGRVLPGQKYASEMLPAAERLQMLETSPLGGLAGLSSADAAGARALAGSSSNIYQINQMVIQANNPAELQAALANKSRLHALSGNPMSGPNLGVGS